MPRTQESTRSSATRDSEDKGPKRAKLLGANFHIARNPAGGIVVSIEVDLSGMR
jgi:hypothetical protein